MPGRLIFSTTADGASTVTERMRIDSAGNVSIGTSAASAGTTLRLSKSITGAVASYGILNNGTIQSDVTSQANIFTSNASTVASAFTLATLRHFYVNQGTVGATSAITNQYGFFAESGMTGATNNYGFYGDLASGTGRYNFYANGTADNYMAGKTGIGGTASVGQILRVGGSLTGSTSSRQVIANGIVASDVTARADSFYSVPQTAASAFTLGILSHFHAVQSTIGAGSSVTTQIGFEAESSLTGATSNYGFYGNIASGTGRYNFYANGTADNYMAGALGIGTTSLTNVNLRLSKTITGSTTSYGLLNEGVVQSDSTSAGRGIASGIGTQATTFTLGNLSHFYVFQGTFGAGSTVTNQFGFIVDSTLTGATNNYGFYGYIGSGTGRYNFYAGGTADNYFAGNVGIGTSSPSTRLQANNSISTVYSSSDTGAGGVIGYIRNTSTTNGTDGTLRLEATGSASVAATTLSAVHTGDGASALTFGTRTNAAGNIVERMRIDSSGNVGIGVTPSGTYKLQVTGSIGSSGTYTNTASAGGEIANSVGATTANTYYRSSNTGGSTIFGSESSAGASIMVGSSAYSGVVNVTGAYPLGFGTNNTERMRIDSSGNVLIGTTTSPAGTKELVLGGDYIEGVVAIGNSATAKTISLANGTFQTVTMTGNCTFTMPTAIAGKSFILIVSTGAGSFTGTFTSVKWPNNTAPTLTTTATRWDILTFASDGTNWYGNFAQAYQ
jgi:hypothetical protein